MTEKSSGIPLKRTTVSSTSRSSPSRENKTSFSPTHQMARGYGPKHYPSSPHYERNDSKEEKCSGKTHKSNSGDATKDTVREKCSSQNKREHLNTSHLYTPDTKQNILYYLLLLFMTVLGLSTRLYRIEVPNWIW